MERRKIAKLYTEGINNPKVILPYVNPDCIHVWHIFGIRCTDRESLERHLNNNGIETNKHYPIPMHMQECYKELGISKGTLPIAEKISATELSIPMYYGMDDEKIQYVINCINNF